MYVNRTFDVFLIFLRTSSNYYANLQNKIITLKNRSEAIKEVHISSKIPCNVCETANTDLGDPV